MGNAKKGHNKTGAAKVVAPKRRASPLTQVACQQTKLPHVEK